MGDGDLTLAIGLGALQRLASPADVVADAHRWSTNVGVTTDRPVESTQALLDEYGVDCDFVSGSGGQSGSLAAVRQRYPSDRYVFVGADESERRTAQALGWESLPVAEAAAKADWELAEETDG